jgi:hypothetical protein
VAVPQNQAIHTAARLGRADQLVVGLCRDALANGEVEITRPFCLVGLRELDCLLQACGVDAHFVGPLRRPVVPLAGIVMGFGCGLLLGPPALSERDQNEQQKQKISIAEAHERLLD